MHYVSVIEYYFIMLYSLVCLLVIVAVSQARVTLTTCESKTLTIECGSKTIRIFNANYGRTAINTCIDSNMNNLTCSAANSRAIVKDRCDGMHSCSISADNGVFGDPCFGTSKYLEVSFECYVPCHNCCKQFDADLVPVKHAVTCVTRSMSLSCKKGELLHIISANYGRTNPKTCNGKATDNINCVSDNSIWIVAEKCERKRSCSIPVNNGVFGNPCGFTNKYLEVYYKCLPDVHSVPY